MAKDPVCGMTVEPEKTAATSEYKGETIYFCNPKCKKKFDEAPDAFLTPARTGKLTLPVEGMSCGKCAAKIDNALRGTDGVMDCTVSHVAKKADIEFDAALVDKEGLIKIIEGLGYTVPEEMEPETAIDPICRMTVEIGRAHV